MSAPAGREAPLIRVRGLVKHFPVRGGFIPREISRVRAVDGVSFDIHRGETLGLVGESGCGKSTVGRSLLRLIEATEGEIHFDGEDVRAMGPDRLRKLRRRAQIVFQDPYSSLNPRMTVGDTIDEVLRVHRLCRGRAGRVRRTSELLDLVGLSSSHSHRYPHEFSGGQRQRIGIARALAVEPEFLVCDEPVSALDVSVRAQVVNLLQDLQAELGLTYLFIAHDLALVEHVSDRVAVMYLGKIMESAPVEALYREAAHPYTRALLSSAPRPRAGARGAGPRILLEGDVPSPFETREGCPFHSRCWHPDKDGACQADAPPLESVGKDHLVACIKARKHAEIET